MASSESDFFLRGTTQTLFDVTSRERSGSIFSPLEFQRRDPGGLCVCTLRVDNLFSRLFLVSYLAHFSLDAELTPERVLRDLQARDAAVSQKFSPYMT
jgi:hypothetical protein